MIIGKHYIQLQGTKRANFFRLLYSLVVHNSDYAAYAVLRCVYTGTNAKISLIYLSEVIRTTSPCSPDSPLGPSGPGGPLIIYKLR